MSEDTMQRSVRSGSALWPSAAPHRSCLPPPAVRPSRSRKKTRMCEHAITTAPRTRTHVLPARPDQVREARTFLRAALAGCPVADDAILCASELAANSCLHSASGKAGGTFTVRAEIHEGDYVWIEVEDNGGPWQKRDHRDGRPYGLDIVRALAADWGIDGDPLTGWAAWARINWPPASGPAS